MGSDICRCLTNMTHLLDASIAAAHTANDSYGIGCLAHDAEGAGACQPEASEFDTQLCDDSIAPRPSFCDESRAVPNYCGYSWCYVNPLQCQMANTHSLAFTDSARYYSYATCGYPDFYSGEAVRDALRGSILRVQFMHNTGGYIGAYHPLPGNDHRDNEWFGPYVDLIHSVASKAGFVINITEMPEYAWRMAAIVTNSSSSFEQCGYWLALPPCMQVLNAAPRPLMASLIACRWVLGWPWLR